MSVSYPFLIVNLWYGVGALSSPFFKMSQNPEQTIAELQQKIKSLELQLKKAKDSSGYGLKWEEKPEIFEERAQNALPLLKEDKSLLIDNKSDLDHIIIEWDNYHALSALNYTHKWMVDVIYIDPPYNTGNKDFIYNDNYVDPEDTYRHSKWLSFMNKRLRLARNLLSYNWAIFISIDDNEQANLRLLCDNIFWENNFIFQIAWRRTDNQPNIWVSAKVKEYIISYAKDYKSLQFWKLSLSEKAKNEYRYKDDKWFFRRAILLDKTRWRYYYEVKTKSGKILNWPWMKPKEELEKLDKDNLIYWTSWWDEQPYWKIYLSNSKWQIPNDFWWIEFWTNQRASIELENIFWKRIFDFPKPVSLLESIIWVGSNNKNSIILDFFAGSGTTWHAVLNLNKQDWWHRQFILCSNRENSKEEPDKNICKDITYERNKRVLQWYTNLKGEKIKWLWWWNLRYYSTEFIEKKKSTDDLRQSFIYLCDELLCIKEDTFNEYKSELLSDKLKCYQKNDHYTVILYDIREVEKLQQLLSTLDGKISVYIFSLSKDSCEEELQEFSDKITIENIPDDILETYKKIF